AESGKQLWTHDYAVSYGKLDYGNGPRATPTVRDGKVYAFGALGHLHCLEAKTGKVLWSHDTVKAFAGKVPSWGHACSPLIDDKGRNPKVVWEGKDLSLLMSTPLVKGKHVYALDRDRGLKCLEMRTGKVVWQNEHVTPRGRNPHASLAWVGGDRALILNTPGELALVGLTPAGLKRCGKASVLGQTWVHLAFAGGCV